VNLDKKETGYNKGEVHKSNRECKNERERERERERGGRRGQNTSGANSTHRRVNLCRRSGSAACMYRGLSVGKQCLSETAAISLIGHSNAK